MSGRQHHRAGCPDDNTRFRKLDLEKIKHVPTYLTFLILYLRLVSQRLQTLKKKKIVNRIIVKQNIYYIQISSN